MPSKRNTRSMRKGKDANKDWKKLDEGSPLPEEIEVNPAPTKKESKRKMAAANKQQQKQRPSDDDACDTSGDEFCDELLLDSAVVNNVEKSPTSNRSRSSSPTIKNNSDSDSEVDDDSEDLEFVRAVQKLEKLKKQEEKRKRNEELNKIVEETKRLEKSLKESSTASRKKQSRQLTTADLRCMSDIASKVDKVMDTKKLNFKDQDSSAASDSDGSDDNTCDFDKINKCDEERERKEKLKEKKKSSGKECKSTSNVQFPQIWPHSALKIHILGKEKDYDELSLAEFCAGYVSILKKCEKAEKQARINHFEELMYLATHKPWKAVLNYHGACLTEIERGNVNWGDNFQLHGLHYAILNASSKTRGQGGFTGRQQAAYSSSPAVDDKIWFCKPYQRGACNQTRDHNGFLFGESKFLRHICGKCWTETRKQVAHPEQSEQCPFSGL